MKNTTEIFGSASAESPKKLESSWWIPHFSWISWDSSKVWEFSGGPNVGWFLIQFVTVKPEEKTIQYLPEKSKNLPWLFTYGILEVKHRTKWIVFHGELWKMTKKSPILPDFSQHYMVNPIPSATCFLRCSFKLWSLENSKKRTMWVKQCHKTMPEIYHRWLPGNGKFIPPTKKLCIIQGWCKWHSFTNINIFTLWLWLT